MSSDLKEFEELVQDCEQFESNVYDLERILRSPKLQQTFFKELDTSSCTVVKKHVQSIIEENKAQMKTCKTRMDAIAAAKCFQIRDYYIQKAVQEAYEQNDSDWKKEADRYLENVRPCKRVRGNITTIVPLGASGFSGSMKDNIDGDIDVLDSSASPDMEDRSYGKLSIFSAENDDRDQEKPSMVISSRAIKIGTFIVEDKFAAQLKPHQIDAAKCMLKSIGIQKSGFLLAHSMGLGKTITGIAVLQAISVSAHCRMVIACPKSVINHWYTTMEAWEEHITFTFYPPVETDDSHQENRWSKKGGVLIMTHNRFTKMTLEDGFSSDIVMVDEAHLMKNPSTHFYDAMSRHNEPKLLLTGSPLQNHLTEYYSMIKLIKPDLIEEKIFRNDFAKVIDRGAFATATPKELAAARTKIAVLTRLTEPYVHRRSSAALKEALKPMKEYKLSYKAPYATNTQSPLECSNETITISMSITIKLACVLLDSIAKSKDKVLVFSRRKEVLTDLQKKRAGMFMDGETSAKIRHELVTSFQDAAFAEGSSSNIFYMTTKVGGVGLNLTRACRVLLLDPSWNPVDDEQACYRVFRYGQTKTVRVYRFIVKDSIQERIYRAGVHKILAACRILDEKEVNRHFTEGQLMALDDVDHEILTSTGDKALDRVIHHFAVTSHDVLFADSNLEKLTGDEKNDADNQFNRLKYVFNAPRSIDDSDTLLHNKHDFIMKDGTLVPPLPPVYTSYALPGILLSTWEALMPFSPSLTHYTLCLKSVGDVAFEETYTVVASSTQIENWAVKIPFAGQFRMRCKSMMGDQESAWSEWSAVVNV